MTFAEVLFVYIITLLGDNEVCGCVCYYIWCNTTTLAITPEASKLRSGCPYSLDWSTGLDYWTGLLDSRNFMQKR